MQSSPPSQRTGAYTTPTLMSLKALEEMGARVEAPLGPAWLPAPASLLRTAVLAAGAAVSAAVASAGFLVLLYLLATHSLTPRQLMYTTPLQLDLSGNDLVSTACMGAPAAAAAAPDAKSAAGARFLPPGQHVDVWLDLEVPVGGVSAAYRGGGLAYVSASLLGGDDAVAVAKSTHPVVLRTRAAPLWAALTAPLRWVGLQGDARTVSVQLFSDYAERREAPFDAFQVSLRPRPGAPAPPVVGAALRVHLRVGWMRWALYHARPHSLLALAMGAGAACALAGGAGGVALCLGLLAYLLLWGGAKTEEKTARGLSPPSRSDSEATELLAGVSSSATTPREMSEEDEAAAAAAGGGSPPEAAPRDERPWQQLLKQVPAGGRPLPGEDTPYVGSDAAAGGGSGRVELGGGGIRLRGASSASRDPS